MAAKNGTGITIVAVIGITLLLLLICVALVTGFSNPVSSNVVMERPIATQFHDHRL